MTVKEAVENLSFLLGKLEDDCPDGWFTYTKLDIDALKMAIEALQKQKAQAPILEGDGYADGYPVYDTWICPDCGKYHDLHGACAIWRDCPNSENLLGRAGGK